MQKWRYGVILKKVKARAVVMDIGCGNPHRFLDLIQGEVREAYGFDKRVEPDKKSKIETIKYNFDNREKVTFPLPEGTRVDQAFMLAVIEHVNQAETILDGIHEALSDGGELFITTPSRLSKPVLEFLSYKLKIIDEKQIRDHKHYYSRDEIIELLDKSGFTAIKHKYFQFWMNQMVTAVKPVE